MAASVALETFLEHLARDRGMYFPAVERTREQQPADFEALGSVMADWAAAFLEDEFPRALVDGYVSFVTDVNRSQMRYERAGHYRNRSYAEVNEAVYGNPEHMKYYHWGVYVTTFAWEHHLRIHRFFMDYFLPLLDPAGGRLLDLGSGSGIWSSLVLRSLPAWRSVGVDISETSVGLSSRMAGVTGLDGRAVFRVDDALEYREAEPFDAAVSCFLLEHLERPEALFASVARNLEARSYAFMTGALTAAEVDHIAEFRRESELVRCAEEAGFRVVATLSASPSTYPADYRFLPRSMAMVLQKRRNEVW